MTTRALKRHGDFGNFGHDVAVARPAHVWTKDHLGRFNELAAMAAMAPGKSTSPVGVVLGLAGLGLLGAAVYYAMKAPALPSGGTLPAVNASASPARPAAPAAVNPTRLVVGTVPMAAAPAGTRPTPAAPPPRVPTPAQAAPQAFDSAGAAATSQAQSTQDAWNTASAAAYAADTASAPPGTVFANPDGTVGTPGSAYSAGPAAPAVTSTGGTGADPNTYTSVANVPDPAPAPDDGSILSAVAGIFS